MAEFLFSDVYVNMWAALAAIFNGVASILAVWALIYSMKSFKTAMVASHYGELDKTYFELLKTALDKPYLYNPSTISQHHQQQEYDLYAFMMWNFLEAIYDRSKNDQYLCETWYPIIDDEMSRHYQWFHQTDNLVRFKTEFIDFIDTRTESKA